MKEFFPKLIILNTPEQVAEKAAKIISSEILAKPDLVIGFASGSTMIPIYKNLVGLSKTKKITFKKIKAIQIDEYLAIPKENPNSFNSFLRENLFSKLDFEEKNLNFLDSETNDPDAECKSYENMIKSLGGLDLLILGLGVNSHIAFNEPGSSQKTKTRLIRLSKETIIYNSRFFSSGEKTPKQAMTIGISTILCSKKIVLIAFGENKLSALQKTLNEKISSKIPASFLRAHKNVTFIVDKKAYGK